MERNRAAKVAHTNAPELTPDRNPNADARSLSDILSDYKQKIPQLQHSKGNAKIMSSRLKVEYVICVFIQRDKRSKHEGRSRDG